MNNCGNWYEAVSTAERPSRTDHTLELLSDNRSDPDQVLTGLGLGRIIEGLKRRLTWYGLRSIELGPFVKIKDDTISIDLFVRDLMVGRVEVDQHSGAVTRWFLTKGMRSPLLFSGCSINSSEKAWARQTLRVAGGKREDLRSQAQKAITHEEALASLRARGQLAQARVDLQDVTEDREA
jgi:hypothetical protein